MALALANRSDLHVHVFHDERAAAFAALGIGLQGTPAILLCTSGTAAAHFHAAVIEANLSNVPILVCTADRPPELRDVGAPQTIDQIKLYGSAVRWFHDPGVADQSASGSWRSLAAHAFAAATGLMPGPVHLNLPFREPLLGQADALPCRVGFTAVDAPSSPVLADTVIDEIAGLMAGRRGVIVAGRGCGSADAVGALALAAGWPVLADARSGLRHRADVSIAAADSILRSSSFATSHRPEIVLRLGAPPASKVLNQWLAEPGVQQVHVAAVPTWTDPDGVLTRRLVADPTATCRSLAACVKPGEATWPCDWLGDWLAAEQAAQGAIASSMAELAARANGSISEPLIARTVVAGLGVGAQLVVSSSMPIRDVEWYSQVPDGVTVNCNRGANGIDGVIATAIGVALATSAPTTVLIGDVAFLHDSSALIGLGRRGVDLLIVVVDNDGGGIFSFLPPASTLPSERFEQLFGTPHGVDLLALSKAHGLDCLLVESEAELQQAMVRGGPAVTMIRSERTGNVTAHEFIQRVVADAVAKLKDG